MPLKALAVGVGTGRDPIEGKREIMTYQLVTAVPISCSVGRKETRTRENRNYSWIAQ